MKLFLIPMCALALFAEDAPKEQPKISDAQIIAYFKARAESDEASAVAKIKGDALQAAVEDMKKTCPVTLDPQTGMPTCPAPPKSDK